MDGSWSDWVASGGNVSDERPWSDDLLLWLRRSRIRVDSFIKFGSRFVGFLQGFDVALVELGLRFALGGAAVDGVDGAAHLADECEHLRIAGVAGLDVLGHGDVTAEGFHEVGAGDAGGLLAEQLELFEQQIVSGRCGDVGPVGFD